MIKLVSNHPNFKMTVEDEIEMLILKRKNPDSPVCAVLPSRLNHLDVEYALYAETSVGNLAHFYELYRDHYHELTVDIWINHPNSEIREIFKPALAFYSDNDGIVDSLLDLIFNDEVEKRNDGANELRNLINGGYSFNFNIRGGGKQTSLISNLIAYNEYYLATQLINLGANVNLADIEGCTPLIWAALRGHLDMVNSLIAAGADVNAENKDKKTPLILAAQNGRLDVVNSLIAAGANVNAEDKDKKTPLIFAAYKGHLEIVNSLIAAGADVNAEDKDKNTPLILAAQNGRLDMVNSLIAAGADVHATDEDGFNAIYHALSGLAEDEPDTELYELTKDIVNLCIRHGVNPIIIGEDGSNKIISSLDNLIQEANEQQSFDEAQILIDIKQELEAYISEYEAIRSKLDSSFQYLPGYLQESLLFAPVSSTAMTLPPEESAKIKHDKDVATAILLKLEREQATGQSIS